MKNPEISSRQAGFLSSLGWLCGALALLLAGCVSDFLTREAEGETYTVGGHVSGLQGRGLKLQLNGRELLPIEQNGAFRFAGRLLPGAPYEVAITAQPVEPAQECSVAQGLGTLGEGDVSSVAVECVEGIPDVDPGVTFSVGGTVAGLEGAGLVLVLNGASLCQVSPGEAGAPVPFTCAQRLTDGEPYGITVLMQPESPWQQCSITEGTGVGAIAGADVTSVEVVCETNRFQVGGTVQGLQGAGLVLRLNGGGDLPIEGNGDFLFPEAIASGATYEVTVLAQPTGPAQECTVAMGTGAVANAQVDSVRVTCSAGAGTGFLLGGKVRGLAGSGLRIVETNSASVATPAMTGAPEVAFSFPNRFNDNAAYSVEIQSDPQNRWQTCSVTEGTGVGRIPGADVTSIEVVCETNAYTVGGQASGLKGTGLLLRLNGGADLQIAPIADPEALVPFTFAPLLKSGEAYEVAIKGHPWNPWQTCEVRRGTGQVKGDNIEDVLVGCAFTDFILGGTVTNLLGEGLSLKLMASSEPGAEIIEQHAFDRTGTFSFAFEQTFQSGDAYYVALAGQPTSPWQTCAPVQWSGVFQANSDLSIAVSCQTNTYPLNVEVLGLVGPGLVLQNNGAGDLAVGADGTHVLAGSLLSGQSYDVTILRQPVPQTCAVLNQSGVVAGEAVTVRVECGPASL